jgi:hypothetical protein
MAGSNLTTFGYGNVYANPYDWSQTSKYQYNGSSSSNTGKSNMVIGPELLFGGASSLIGGALSAFGANQQSKAMIQAAGVQAQAQRDAAFQNLLAGQYALTGAKQFDRLEQQKAANYQQAFLDPRTSQLSSEDRQRGITDALSPGAQKLRWQQNADQLNRTLSEQRARTDAMFGQVAQQPFSYGNMPGYAAGSLA